MKSWIKFLLLGLVATSMLTTVRADDDDVTVDDAVKTTGTDSDAAKTEAEAMSYDGFSPDEVEKLAGGQESHEFQAEVNRLMDIIINSLYSNREIFIRELISNASDALDKIRFAALTDKSILGETTDLSIRIKFDRDAKTITLRDTGVGMTKEHLIKNLGTVAKSGTTEFVERAASGADTLSLIGQFGVGFYSVYLIADEVSVTSKHNDDEQYLWKSTANQTFTIAKDPRGNTLGRGTKVVLKLKEDAEEFLNQETIRKLITKYSQFIQFPIYLWTSKTESKEVPVEEEAKEEVEEDKVDDEDGDDDALEVSDDEEEDKEEDKPKTKTVTETVWDWEHINTNKPVWTKKPSEVEESEYIEFYKSLTKETDGPLEYTHFAAEGQVSFNSVLYIPKKAPHGFYDNYYKKSTSLKLYVRKVLIAEEFDDFMPRYLGFIKGVVDSDDLPLNVSRETLQQSKVLRVMSKKLTRKAIAMLRKMSEDCEEDDEEEEEEKAEEKVCKYDDFYTEFGKSIKLGILEDSSNKKKLAKLLRFETTKSDGALISLQEYVDNMPEKQSNIFYITGESKELVIKSPFLERLKKKGLEVIYMVDALDEYIINSLTEFDGVKLMSVTKDDLKVSEDDEERFKEAKEEFKDFNEFMKTTLGSKVNKVEVSNRLVSSPCTIVTSKYGWSANMERIMKAQTLGQSADSQPWMKAQKTLEINPRHPIIRTLKKMSEDDKENGALKQSFELLYSTALLSSGFAITETEEYANLVHGVIGKSLDLEDLSVEEDETDGVIEGAEEEEEEEEEEEAEEEEEEEEEETSEKDEL